MKYKCIGGKMDGEVFDIFEDTRIGDQIRVHMKQNLTYKPYLQPIEIVPITHDVYQLTSLNFPDGSIYKFLIPSDWSLQQAVKYLFDRYNK